jgi:hypothetical protein
LVKDIDNVKSILVKQSYSRIFISNKNLKTQMKKFIAIAAVAMTFTACNPGSTTEETTATDTTAVVVVDTTVNTVDTTKVDTTTKHNVGVELEAK